MEREEKVRERRRKKKPEQEFIGIKLKRGILVGKRGGTCTTPSPTWNFGLPQTDDSCFQDFTFPSNPTSLSVRNLGANLWEVQPHLKVIRMNNNGGPELQSHRKNQYEIPKQTVQPPDNSSDQAKSAENLIRHHEESVLQHHKSLERDDHPLQPESPASCNSSVEIALCNKAVGSSLEYRQLDRKPSKSFSTSREFLKVLNRIWSLEEQHISNASLINALTRELNRSREHLKELLQERKRERNEMNNVMKQIAEDNDGRRSKEQDLIEDAVQMMRNELEDERRLKRHSEYLQRKLGWELSDMKSSFSYALEEFEKEKKARIMLEDLCDEFAKAMREYEQEIRLIKHKSKTDPVLRQHNDRLILHISEAWLDARMQLKPVDKGKRSVLDKLSCEIETFLREKQHRKSGNDALSSISNRQQARSQHRDSLESLHLNEDGSVPHNELDEDDLYECHVWHPEAKSNAFVLPNTENALKRHFGEEAKNHFPMQKATSSYETAQNSHLSASRMDIGESVILDTSLEGSQNQDGNAKTGRPNIEHSVAADDLERLEMTEVVVDSSLNKKDKQIGTQSYLLNILKRNHSSSEGKKLQDKEARTGNTLNPSSVAGPTSPVQKWTPRPPATDLVASLSSSKRPQVIKENTLREKLLEARMEGQKLRARISRGPS